MFNNDGSIYVSGGPISPRGLAFLWLQTQEASLSEDELNYLERWLDERDYFRGKDSIPSIFD